MRAILTALALFAILVAPSIWMLATIPPLWRDADAYDQIILSPARSAAKGHGPLYGIVVRAPLSLGARLEHSAQPVTDTGIYLLVGAQHLALCTMGLALILSATKSLTGRLLLAVFFATNSVFYTLAHCVGSESLSLLCLLALVLAGLRLLERASLARWIFFALALFLFLLTRYVNWFLIFALPLTFSLLAVQRRTLAPLRQAAIAFALGLLCLAGMRGAVVALTRPAVHSYYPNAGFTFLWRLSFLEAVPEPRRSALLDQIDARTRSADAHKLISALRAVLAEHDALGPFDLYWRFRAALDTPEKPVSTRRFYLALHALARAFLLPPTPEHWRAAEKDFANAWQTPMPVLSATFFATTVFCFEHGAEMPELMSLSTFRNHTPGELMTIATSSLYFRATSYLSLGILFLLWLLLATFLALRKNAETRPVLFYGLSLVAIGILILQASALIIGLSPRYTLPLWELLWLCLIIYAGKIFSEDRAEALVRREEKPAGPWSLG